MSKDKAEEPEEILIVMPVDQAIQVVPGSIRCNCPKCGTECFVAPMGQDKLRQGMPLMCLVCAVKSGTLKKDLSNSVFLLPPTGNINEMN